jgi:hypothetical protein
MFQAEVLDKSKHTFFENLAFYGIMWKSIVELDKPHDNSAHALCMMDN